MKKIMKSPLFWAVFALCLSYLATRIQRKEVSHQSSHRVWSLAGSQDALLLPYVTPGKVYGISLDGGRAPVFANEVPRLYFRESSDQPLHLVLLADLHSAAGREWLRRFEKIYDTDVKENLPALALIVLPSTPEPQTNSINEIVIAVHFVANQSQTLPGLLEYISQNAMTPEMIQLHDFLHQAEPEIMSRVEMFLKRQNPFIEKIWQMARSQHTRSSQFLDCNESNQLISMRQVLTGSPPDEEIVAFLHQSKAAQDTYLSSPKGLVPVTPPSGCDCKDVNHPHIVPSP